MEELSRAADEDGSNLPVVALDLHLPDFPEADATTPVPDVLQTSSASGTFSLAAVNKPQHTQLNYQSLGVQVDICLHSIPAGDWTPLNPVLVGEGGFDSVPLGSANAIGVYLLEQVIAGISELRNNAIVGPADSVVANASTLLTTWAEEAQSNLADSVAGHTSREQFFRRLSQEFALKVINGTNKLIVAASAGFLDTALSAGTAIAGQVLAGVVTKLVNLGCAVTVYSTLRGEHVAELAALNYSSVATELTSWMSTAFSGSEFYTDYPTSISPAVSCHIQTDAAVVSINFTQE